VQIMLPEQVNYRFFPFEITKVWFHNDFPMIPVGRVVLNRNPENYFADIEQAAFNPGSFVPGISFSPDKMLQARLISYHDAHLYRLGPNYQLLPVNRPKTAIMNNYQRDGFMRVDNNGKGAPNYYPNSFGGPMPSTRTVDPPMEVSGKVGRYAFALTDIDFVQPGELYRRVMSDQDREHLINNIVGHLGNAQKRIQLRQTALFYKADPDYGQRVARSLSLDITKIEHLARISNEERVQATCE